MVRGPTAALIVLQIALVFCRHTANSIIGDRVYRLSPKAQKQRDFVRDLITSNGLDVWSESRSNDDVTVRLTKADIDKLLPVLRDSDIIYNIVIPDVSGIVEQQHHAARRRKRSVFDPLPRLDQYNSVHDINTILAWIARACEACTMLSIGHTSVGLPLYVLQVGSGKKDAIFLNGGLHAREWISPATVLYLAYQIAINPTNDKEITKLKRRFDWFFLVLANPDGYDFSLKYPWTRFWRKTRSENKGVLCKGTDANRNFDFHWAEVGSGDDPCEENYFGSTPFSEPETRAMRDFVLEHLPNIKAYISFHSYGQHWVYPWLFGNCSSPPDDIQDLRRLAFVAVERIGEFSGTRYSFGQAGCHIYPAAGASDDWMKGVAGVKYSYTVELPDREDGPYGFMLPSSRIVPIANETLEGVKAFALELDEVLP